MENSLVIHMVIVLKCQNDAMEKQNVFMTNLMNPIVPYLVMMTLTMLNITQNRKQVMTIEFPSMSVFILKIYLTLKNSLWNTGDFF